MSKRRVVLVDRDGTIVVERDHLSSPEQLELLDGAASGLRLLRELGLPAIVITNQSAISRGYLDGAALEQIHARLSELLAAQGTAVDAFYVCPHHPDDGCVCRKPAPELAYRAAADFGADLGRSFVVGDKLSDIGMGKQVGATTILVRTGYGADVAASPSAVEADFVVDDLYRAACVIRELLEQKAAAQ